MKTTTSAHVHVARSGEVVVTVFKKGRNPKIPTPTFNGVFSGERDNGMGSLKLYLMNERRFFTKGRQFASAMKETKLRLQAIARRKARKIERVVLESEAVVWDYYQDYIVKDILSWLEEEVA